MTANEMNVESYRSNMMEGLPPYLSLAMAYVVFQSLHTVYEPEDALVQGTIFPELDKPWYGSRANMHYKDNANYAGLEMQKENAENKATENYRRMEYPANRFYDERGMRR